MGICNFLCSQPLQVWSSHISHETTSHIHRSQSKTRWHCIFCHSSRKALLGACLRPFHHLQTLACFWLAHHCTSANKGNNQACVRQENRHHSIDSFDLTYAEQAKRKTLEKENTNLCASAGFASSIRWGLVLNWFPLSQNFKSGGKIID